MPSTGLDTVSPISSLTGRSSIGHATWRRQLKTLGLTRFSVIGGSGGGPYALACAYELPGRVTRAGLISGVGPYDAPGATRGMRWQNRLGFQFGARFPPTHAGFIMSSMERQLRRDPERTLNAIARAMSPADAEIARRPEVHEVLAAEIAEAFRQGSRGAARDVVLLGRSWGFHLDAIKPVVLLWQGEDDVLVPPAMGRHLATQIPELPCDVLCRRRPPAHRPHARDHQGVHTIGHLSDSGAKPSTPSSPASPPKFPPTAAHARRRALLPEDAGSAPHALRRSLQPKLAQDTVLCESRRVSAGRRASERDHQQIRVHDNRFASAIAVRGRKPGIAGKT